MSKRHSYKHVERTIQKKGGILLSETYINNESKLKVRCSNNHEWLVSFSKIQLGRWCPICAKQKQSKRQSFTYQEVADYIKQRGGTLISDVYINSKQLLEIECRNGHRWKARLNNIRNMNRWCHYCGGTKKLSLQDAINVAREKNGKCLSKEYINSIYNKMLWECEKGHRWEATLNNIKSGNKWCPTCSAGKSQSKLFKILKEIFDNGNYNFYYNFKGFNWLNTIGKISQEIDIFIEAKNKDFSLGIEYDGEQHHKPIKFFGGEDHFLYIKKMDKLKDQKIKQHSDDVRFFVRFPYWEKLDKDNVKNVLKKNGVLCDQW